MRPLFFALLILSFPAQAWGGEGPAPARTFLTIETGGHRAAVTRVLFTPDSKTLITTSLDKTVRLWDAGSGEALKVLRPPVGPGREGELLAAALAPDGKTLAVAGYGYHRDGKHLSPVFLVSLETGQITRALAGHGAAVRALAFAPAGGLLASASERGVIAVWDVSDGKQVARLDGHKGGTDALAFAPDGKRLASVGKDQVGRVWSVESGLATAELQTANVPALHDVAWSPDGKSIVTGTAAPPSSLGQFIPVWSPEGKLVRRIAHPKNRLMRCNSLAFTPDSRGVLATASDGYYAFVILYDLATGEERTRFISENHLFHDVPQGSAVVSPNGKLAAVAGDRNHQTYVYGTAGGKLLRKVGGQGRQTTGLGWVKTGDPDRRQIVWRTSLTGQQFKPWEPIPAKFFERSFRLDDLALTAVPEGQFRWHQYRHGPVGLRLKGSFVEVEGEGEKPLRLRPPGGDDVRLIDSAVTLVGQERAAVSNSTGFYLFDTASGKQLHTFRGPNGVVRAAAPSPAGDHFLLAGGDDQVLRVWDPRRIDPLLSLFVAGQDWVAWTPAGYYAATPGGERLMGWHVNDGLHKMGTFHPADRFRKQLYRPDVIRLVLNKGSVQAALKAADEARGTKTRDVAVEELLPPRATLTVVDQKSLPQVKVKASAVAAVPGQPVTALRLLLDGRPLAGRACTLDLGTGKAQAEAEWTLTLPEGKHSLTVLAKSPDASAVSAPVDVAHVDAGKLPVLHVVAVGVSAYEEESLKLDFAAIDAEALTAAFRRAGKGGLFGDVEATALVNGKAKRQAVLDALAALRKRVKANDLAVVFFAGHGVKVKDQFYLLTVEARVDDLAKTTISGEDLRKALAEFPCQVLLMLDACHSAASLKSLRPAVDDATRTLTEDEVGVAVLCAAMGHEKALEKEGNGLFTRAVVQALGKAEGVPYNRYDRRLYVHHLHAYVADEVRQHSGDRQHPFLSLPWVVEPFPVTQFAGKETQVP